MAGRELKNKPLVEALIELRWALQSSALGVNTDPHYKLLLGRFYDKISSDYPEHEQLPSATMPDELVGYIVQHRFRSGPEQWPLVQIGPGILTVNDTDKYSWKDFRMRIITARDKLFESYPKVSDLVINNIVLRYIDAIEFDYLSQDTLLFMEQNMKINIQLPNSLFETDKITKRPQNLIWQTSFMSQEPKGLVSLRFATGQSNNKPALIWETLVQSQGDDTPTTSAEFVTWIDSAHSLTDDWFFKLIEGQLEQRFLGD